MPVERLEEKVDRGLGVKIGDSCSRSDWLGSLLVGSGIVERWFIRLVVVDGRHGLGSGGKGGL